MSIYFIDISRKLYVLQRREEAVGIVYYYLYLKIELMFALEYVLS